MIIDYSLKKKRFSGNDIESFEKVDSNKFTKKEHSVYNKRDRNFIIGIMIKENISKESAIARLKQYIAGTIKNRKLFRKRVAESIRRYGKWKGKTP